MDRPARTRAHDYRRHGPITVGARTQGKRYTAVVKKLITLCAFTVCLVPLEAADARAVEIANAMMTAMGGVDNWNRAHFVRYDFKVNIGGKLLAHRSHLWDKMTGRYQSGAETSRLARGQCSPTDWRCSIFRRHIGGCAPRTFWSA